MESYLIPIKNGLSTYYTPIISSELAHSIYKKLLFQNNQRYNKLAFLNYLRQFKLKRNWCSEELNLFNWALLKYY
jgi:hypothetical protein